MLLLIGENGHNLVVGIMTDQRVKVEVILILLVDNLKPRAYLDLFSKHDRNFLIFLYLIQTIDLFHIILLVLRLNTSPQARVWILEVKLTQIHLSFMVVVNRGKHLELVR